MYDFGNGNLNSVATKLRNLTVYQSPKISFNETKLQERSIPKVDGDISNIYFRDIISGEIIGAKLTEENLKKIQNIFGDSAVESIGNGKSILNGKAEEFVSGWYGDIAYKRGYLKADADFNGILSAEEKKNTTSFFGIGGFVSGNSIYPTEFLRYKTTNEFSNSDKGSRFKMGDTIADELNQTLQYDKNMDGRIKWGDIASTKDVLEYLKEFTESGSGGYDPSLVLDTIMDFFKEWDKQLKEILNEMLNETDLLIGDVKANDSIEAVFKKIMESPKKEEVLGEIQEKIQEKFNGEQTEKHFNEKSLTKTDSTSTRDIAQDSTFQAIHKLTKLDETILKDNLFKNPNFEDDIIAIVQELAQNLESRQTTLESAEILKIDA
ncbi:hypothetical protein [Helicobacter turcicus]|uniref:EF-hand domain-containing protein n=1 Tax=Helicobacter turcicus TaxID=2867412 RepID=A0ABS7JNQ9_9HELI|nr:hypothetical protein [Helicobacter turcicus]MBX7491032.1 hypothetical protein [Helicobacter turcicus]MBX7546293.1 hypothetical protein [Helicobacter turcicus]